MYYHLFTIITKTNDVYLYNSMCIGDMVLREIFSKDSVKVISSEGEYVDIPTSSIADIKYKDVELKDTLEF
ncbi:hypothetical protein KQUDLBSD_CDS0213 [Staphylococcus phage PG-2021_40]